MKNYNPANWYWTFKNEPGPIFSSATGRDIASPDDPAFVEWSADGSVPTAIANRAELGEVLADARVRPTQAAVLDAYKGQHAKRMTDEVQTKALLWAINQIRTLKGEAPLTTGAAIRAFLKDLM
jgi:hypothetical protein